MFSSYGNQSTVSHCKAIYWFPFDRNIAFAWIKGLQQTVFDALRDLVPFVQIKKGEKPPMKECYFLKVTPLHGCFAGLFRFYKWY